MDTMAQQCKVRDVIQYLQDVSVCVLIEKFGAVPLFEGKNIFSATRHSNQQAHIPWFLANMRMKHYWWYKLQH